MQNFSRIKRYFLMGLVLSTSVPILSYQGPQTGNLTVSVNGLKSSEGEIQFNLFKSAEGFPKDEMKAIGRLRAKITRGNCSVTFELLSFGKYVGLKACIAG